MSMLIAGRNRFEMVAPFAFIIMLTIMVLILAGAHANAAPSFHSLGDLPGGGIATLPAAMSSDGSVVVGSSYSGNGYEAFRWTLESGIVGLGDLPGGIFNSHASGISGDGRVIVGQGIGPDVFLPGDFAIDGHEAYRWTAEEGLVGLGDLPGGLTELSYASDTTLDGSVIIGGGMAAQGNEAYRWTAETGMIGLGNLTGGSGNSGAKAITPDGTVIVGYSDSAVSEGYEAIRWNSTTGMIGLGDLPGGPYISEALDVSSDGQTIVGQGTTEFGWGAFRWTPAEGMIGLGHLPGGNSKSRAQAVSADGSTIVGMSTSADGMVAVIWTGAQGLRTLKSVFTEDYGLDVAGWNLYEGMCISDDGRTIAGNGRNPSGEYVSWIATVPEPATALPLLVVSVFAWRPRRVSPIRHCP